MMSENGKKIMFGWLLRTAAAVLVIGLPTRGGTVLWLTADEGAPGDLADFPVDSGDYSLFVVGLNDVSYSSDVAGVGAAASCRERSFLFDGVDDMIVVAHDAVLNLAGSYTIEFFVKFVAPNSTDVFPHTQVFERRGSGQEYTLLADHGPYSEFVTFLDGATGGGGFSSGSGSLPSLGQWTHVALVYNAANTGREANLYLDGVFQAGRNFVTGQGTGFTMIADLLLGASALGNGRHLDGLLDEIRITDAALAPSQFLNVGTGPGGNPPVIVDLDGTPLLVEIGSDVVFGASFTDLDVEDTHVATWDFGDGSPLEVADPTTSPAAACHTYTAGGDYTVTLTITDECGKSDTETIDVTVLDLAACFAVNRLKVGTKDPRCRGIDLLEVTSTVGGDDLVAVYVPEEGKDKLKAETVVDDGVHGPVTIHTSCSQPLEIGDVFGPYTVTDLVKIFDEAFDWRGNKVEIRGSFDPGGPIDPLTEDVTYTIDDGDGTTLTFSIPAGSFEQDGDPDKEKFKFHSPPGSALDIKAKFDFGKCEFKINVKGVANTNQIVGTTETVRLQVGSTVGEEVVVMEDKKNHLEHKKKPKFECCPKCRGIAFMQVTSDQGVFTFEPEPGKDKLKANTVVDDGMSGAVTIHTSCSQPIEVGDVFGAYTISDLVKVFD